MLVEFTSIMYFCLYLAIRWQMQELRMWQYLWM